MIFLKVIAGLLISVVLICDAQFLTPDQLREQYDLSYGARTHYEMSGSRLTDMFNRVNPDYLLRGFFPFWSVVLIAVALLFLLIAVIGLIGYLLGCRRPTAEELYATEFRQVPPDNEFLLGGGGLFINPDETKSLSNGHFDNNNQPDSRYESRSSAERTRIGQSNEDMV